MKNKSENKLLFLYIITLVNHAFASWLIVYMPHLFPFFSHSIERYFDFVKSIPFFSGFVRTQAQWESVCFGLLLSIKPLGEAVMIGFWSRRPNLRSRFALQVCIILSAAACVSFIISLYFHWLVILMFSQLIFGLSCSAIFIIQLILTALSSVGERTSAFNMMEWSVGLGMSFGPLIGSLLVSLRFEHASILPFFAVFFIEMLLMFFFFRSSYLNRLPLCSVVENVQSPRTLSRMYLLTWLCFQFSFQGYYHWFPSLMKTNFNYSHTQLGRFYTVLGLFYIFCQFFLVRLFAKKNIHRYVVVVGMPVMGAAFITMGFAHTLVWVYIASAFYMIAVSFYLPFWKSYLSLLGSVSSMKLFASMTVLTCLCAIASTGISGALAAISIPYLFSLFGSVMILGVLFFILIEGLRKNNQP